MATGDKTFIADKETLDSVNSKVGATNNTGGSASAGSVFAKLNAIISSIATHVASWTAARATKVDNLDTTVSSRQSETNALTRYNQLNTNTGVNNTASATGTLSQKLSKVIADIATINTNVTASSKRLVAKKVTANIGAGTSVTVLNVVGAGVFYGGTISLNSISAPTVVTIDGVAHTVANNSGGAFGRMISSANMFQNITTPNVAVPVEFKSSLKIDVRAAGDSNVFFYGDYSLYE